MLEKYRSFQEKFQFIDEKKLLKHLKMRHFRIKVGQHIYGHFDHPV